MQLYLAWCCAGACMKSRKWKWFWLIAVIAGSALIPPILFGQARVINDQSGGDPWRNTIFDFQTLLTGVAAVAAASWTVYTMEKTDSRQEQRHRELVSLTMRADRLRADRAVNPQLDDFETYVDEIIARLKYIFRSDENAIKNFDSGKRDYRALGITIETFFSRPAFDEARDLFDGEMAYALARIRYAIQGMTLSWHSAEMYSPPPGMIRTDLTLTDEQRADAIVAWREAARITLSHLVSLEEYTSAFCDGLLKMKKTYES